MTKLSFSHAVNYITRVKGCEYGQCGVNTNSHVFKLKSIQILKARVIKQLLIKSSSNMLRNTKIIHKLLCL